jgi:hypothetical protein
VCSLGCPLERTGRSAEKNVEPVIAIQSNDAAFRGDVLIIASFAIS